MVRLLQYSIGSVGAAFLNLILIPVTTYFLSPAEYGKTSMFLLAQTLLIYFIYLGFDQAFTREFYEYEDDKKLLMNAMLVPFLTTLLLISFMCLFAPGFSYLLFADSHYTGAIYLLAVSTILLIFERFILLFIRMEDRALSFSLYNILIKLMILIVTIIFLLIFKPVFITVVYSMILGQMIGDLILLATHLKLFKRQAFTFDRELIKRLALFGLPIVVATSIDGLFMVMDRIFLRYYASFEELGLFTVALKIASVLLILQVTFSNFWIPTAYKWHTQKKEIQYYAYTSHVVMFLCSFLLIVLIYCQDLITFIVAPAYHEVAVIFPFLCFYPLMKVVSETTGLGIVFSKRSGLNIIVSIFSIVAALILNFLLVPRYGALGASIATGLTYIVYFVVRSYISMRVWESFSLKRHFLVTLLLCGDVFFNLISPSYWLAMVINTVGFCLLLVIYYPIGKKLLEIKKNK